jgi:hypothetical protein
MCSIGETWCITWQWNSQLPARDGLHVMLIVAPDGMSCVTTVRRWLSS